MMSLPLLHRDCVRASFREAGHSSEVSCSLTVPEQIIDKLRQDARKEKSTGSSLYYGFTYDPKVCLCARAFAIDVREV